MPEFIKGMQLSEAFFREAVAPLLAARYPRLDYSAGRLDSGSEVMGFDTPRSADHEWGPRVTLYLRAEEAGLAAELDVMLESLELMKIKLNQNTSEELDTVITGLQARVEGVEHVWTIGKTILVFRPSRNKPTRYALPN